MVLQECNGAPHLVAVVLVAAVPADIVLVG
jgi:hypothetical protein